MSLLFTERRCNDLQGEAVHTLVGLPRAPLVAGRSRLLRFRREVAGHPIDRTILAEIEERPGVSAFAFFGRSDDGRGSWEFSDDLSMAEALELGELFHQSHIHSYRQMVSAGLVVNLHVRWGEREKRAMELGRAKALARLQDQMGLPGRDPALDRLDVWLLEHFNKYYTEAELEDVVPTFSLRRQRALLEPVLRGLRPESISADRSPSQWPVHQ
jgi:hypothetical protein